MQRLVVTRANTKHVKYKIGFTEYSHALSNVYVQLLTNVKAWNSLDASSGSGQSPFGFLNTKDNKVQGRIQELKKGVCFERVRAERGEKFWVTTPTFAKLRPF